MVFTKLTKIIHNFHSVAKLIHNANRYLRHRFSAFEPDEKEFGLYSKSCPPFANYYQKNLQNFYFKFKLI